MVWAPQPATVALCVVRKKSSICIATTLNWTTKDTVLHFFVFYCSPITVQDHEAKKSDSQDSPAVSAQLKVTEVLYKKLILK